MTRYIYSAIDEQGKYLSGRLEASSQNEARSRVSSMDLIPTSVTPAKKSDGEETCEFNKRIKKRQKRGMIYGNSVCREDMSVFTRQLATLLQAKVPLLRSLELIYKQESNGALRTTIGELAEYIRSGSPLAESMAHYPKIFDNLFLNMIKAGEAGGAMDKVLMQLSLFMEKSRRFKHAAITVMIYPVIVLTIATLIVTLLIGFIVPRFRSIYQELLNGAPLPAPTQFVIDMSSCFQNYFVLISVIIATVMIAIKVIITFHSIARFIDMFSLRVPYIGDLLCKITIARFSRTLGTLLSSGVPLIESFTLTSSVIKNQFIRDSHDYVHDCVLDGESIAVALEEVNVFPPVVSGMIMVGEETGDLPAMLNRIADNYDEDVDRKVVSLTAIFEPLMIIILALVIGFIVVALFLPIIGIIQRLSGI